MANRFGKAVRATLSLALLVASIVVAGQSAAAAVLTWNSAASGPPVDADGVWGSQTNWWNGATDVLWKSADGDTAWFGSPGAAACTVALSGTQTVGGLTFQDHAFTLTGPDAALNFPNQLTSVTVNASGGTVGAAIIGPGGLAKAGTGTLVLTAPCCYSGPTNVNGGTLQLNAASGAAGALASPSIAVKSGGFLALDAQDALGYTSGREALTINGGTVSNITPGGRVTFQNAVSMTGGLLTGTGTGDYGGAYSFNFGSIVATSDANGNAALVSDVSISPQGSDLNFNVIRGAVAPASDLTVTASIVPFNGRTYGIVKNGNGILTLTGSSMYTGATTIGGGTLMLGDGGAAGSLPPGSPIIDNATLGFNRSNTVVQGTDFSSAAISGTGGVSQLGTGVLVLKTANTFTGPTVVSGGTLSVSLLADGGAASAVGKSSSDGENLVVDKGGVFQYTGPRSISAAGLPSAWVVLHSTSSPALNSSLPARSSWAERLSRPAPARSA